MWGVIVWFWFTFPCWSLVLSILDAFVVQLYDLFGKNSTQIWTKIMDKNPLSISSICLFAIVWVSYIFCILTTNHITVLQIVSPTQRLLFLLIASLVVSFADCAFLLWYSPTCLFCCCCFSLESYLKKNCKDQCIGAFYLSYYLGVLRMQVLN